MMAQLGSVFRMAEHPSRPVVALRTCHGLGPQTLLEEREGDILIGRCAPRVRGKGAYWGFLGSDPDMDVADAHTFLQGQRLARIFRSPQATIVCGFGFTIFTGALLLMLPWAQRSPRVGFVDALFTSTSAVCVTGLTVVDTGTAYTRLGQAIILALIQVGGLGIMTFAAMAFQIAGMRLSLKSQALLSDSFFQQDVAGEFRDTFRKILIVTFTVEATGTLLLYFVLRFRSETVDPLFSSLFHSVSAFCNAGFSIRSDNLLGLRDNLPVLLIIMTLIVLGGLGYVVLNEIRGSLGEVIRQRPQSRLKPLSTHSRLVLAVSLALIVGGASALAGFGMTSSEASVADRILHALFQSVSARTAGFNTVDIGLLPAASIAALIVLMFIGGSPASCAGGIKTTTLAVWFAKLKASLHGKSEVTLLGRSLSVSLVNRAELVMGLAVFWNLIGVFVLLNTEAGLPVEPLHLIFEQFSAFGTVGLSTGLTSQLSVAGKLWLCLTMFVGRIGTLTVALWVFPATRAPVNYPKGTVMIG